MMVRSSAEASYAALARFSAVPRLRLKLAPGSGLPALSRTVTVIGITSPFFAVALGLPSLLAVFVASSAVEAISIEAASG